MSQAGGNFGDLKATFSVDTTQADAAISKVQANAEVAGTKAEDAFEKKGAKGLKSMAGQALGAAGAVGAVVVSVDRAIKGINEFRDSANALAKEFREIDRAASSIVDSASRAGADYAALERQALEFGAAQIDQLEEQNRNRSAAGLIQLAYARANGVATIEEDKINAILQKRVDLVRVLKVKQDEQLDAARERQQRAESSKTQINEANALNALEKQAGEIRRSALTEQQRQAEDLRNLLADIAAQSNNATSNATRKQFEDYAIIFGKKLDEVLKDSMVKAADQFTDQVRQQFQGIFDERALSSFGVSIKSQLTAIQSQIRNVGSIGGPN